MNRFFQTILILSTTLNCWLGMMIVHELGHVLAGSLTGGEVSKVVVHPFSISRTDVKPNPKPLTVVWAGPVLGVLLPTCIWLVLEKMKLSFAFLFRFFAGFCLIANGAYLGVGSFDSIGDAGDIQKFGSPIWMLWLFGLITIPLGFRLWHGLGEKFGLGKSDESIDFSMALWSLAVTVVVYSLSFLLSPIV